MDWRQHFNIGSKKVPAKPAVSETRLSVEFIIDLLAQGWLEADILRNYPGLTSEDIKACLSYASNALKTEKIYPLNV